MSFLNSVIKKVSDSHVTRRRSVLEPQVVAVLDDFSTLCFADDANIWQIDPQQFSLDLQKIRPDFLLVESAWHGNAGRWRYMVNSGSGPQWPLIKLVELCRQLGIPTVFWNKEDPPHFDEYLPTAKLFDFVFTSDGDMVPKYKSKTSARGVDLLRFAANPKIHNPSRVADYRKGDIAFAGQYFADKFPERRQQMEALFSPARKYDFSIYSRGLGGKDIYQFPSPWDDYVVGSLPYDEMVKAYRRHKVFLNVNSVVSSSTMCARRVFELSAAKTAVVGMHSDAVRSVYSEDQVLLADSPGEVADIYDFLLGTETDWRTTVQRAWRHTLSHHTYRHRLLQITEAIGYPRPEDNIEVIVCVDDSSGSLATDLEKQQFTLSSSVKVEVLHVRELGVHGLRSRLESGGGRRYLAYMSNRWRYGRFYLNDLILSAEQQSAAFVTKCLPGDDPILDETWGSKRLPAHGWLAQLNKCDVGELLRTVETAGFITSVEDDVYVSDPLGIDTVGKRTANALLNV
ncbi:CgeB family protein [Corynebacterium riegelii]|uniref:CgeB family protein n=1 Tax=Corynebacterium riegelii TaxID=156976 RepID=UPI00068DE3C8|nr:glycosyltransferase [Corynebacterium riegelii]